MVSAFVVCGQESVTRRSADVERVDESATPDEPDVDRIESPARYRFFLTVGFAAGFLAGGFGAGW
jgi:uncharacterized membrane protein YfcA